MLGPSIIWQKFGSLHIACMLFSDLLCHATVQQCFYLYTVLNWHHFALTDGGTVCVGKEDNSLGEGKPLA